MFPQRRGKTILNALSSRRCSFSNGICIGASTRGSLESSLCIEIFYRAITYDTKDVEEISKDKSTSLRKLFAGDEDTIKMEFVIYG